MWQPIETAPKDGRLIDAYGRHTSGVKTRIPAVMWDVALKEPRWWSTYALQGSGNYIDPSWTLTHWMPMPAEPE